MSWKQMNMVPLAARTVGFVIRDNACCMSWKSTVYVFLTLNKKPLSFIFVSFFRSNHCKIYYFCQPDVFHHFGQPVCPPAWASKSPKAVPNSSPDSMFPPQQIFGLFVKGMFFFEKTTLGVYPIPSGKKTRNPWGCAKKKSDGHDAILMEEKNQVLSLSLQILREVTWLWRVFKPGGSCYKPLVNRWGMCFLYYSLLCLRIMIFDTWYARAYNCFYRYNIYVFKYIYLYLHIIHIVYIPNVHRSFWIIYCLKLYYYS